MYFYNMRIYAIVVYKVIRVHKHSMNKILCNVRYLCYVLCYESLPPHLTSDWFLEPQPQF